ncbi:MAG: hypothetical protein RI885_2140 [Actinomycetota bacterium]|jgi:AcrR family transcriptional regulator
MPRATLIESEATARRILAASRELFADRGYAAVGLEQIAAQAGVTRGAVYHHFASKEGLFGAVAAASQAQVAVEVESAADSESDDWSGLLAGCRAFLGATLDDRSRRILLIDAPAVLGWARWRGQDAAASGRHLEEALTTLAAAGVISVASVPGATALISGALNEAALQIAESPDRAAALDTLWPDVERLLEAFRAPREFSATPD